MSSFCPACGREIVWATNQGGPQVALNLPPEKRFVFRYAPPRAIVDLVDAYLDHAPLCPQRKAHAD